MLLYLTTTFCPLIQPPAGHSCQAESMGVTLSFNQPSRQTLCSWISTSAHTCSWSSLDDGSSTIAEALAVVPPLPGLLDLTSVPLRPVSPQQTALALHPSARPLIILLKMTHILPTPKPSSDYIQSALILACHIFRSMSFCFKEPKKKNWGGKIIRE